MVTLKAELDRRGGRPKDGTPAMAKTEPREREQLPEPEDRQPTPAERAARAEARVERTIARLYHWLGRNRVTRLPWAVVQTFSRAQGALLSGSMAYYTFLSLVPMLLLAGFVIATIARSNPQVRDAVSTAVGQLLPGVQGKDMVNQLVGARVAFGVFGLLSVAYAGSGFVGAMTACMNRMWGVETGRNPVGQKAFNILIVILLSAVLLGSVGLTVWVQYAARTVLGNDAGPLLRLTGLLASPLSMAVLLLLLYRLLPARKLSWLGQIPGAGLGALGVELLKRGFTLWTEGSAGVAALPRSLLSVVLLLVWLGLFGQLLLYGAALNVVLDRRRRHVQLLPD